jgi:hypothetical protein
MFRTIHSITVRNPSNFTRRLVGPGVDPYALRA